jgi:hypothetical protein
MVERARNGERLKAICKTLLVFLVFLAIPSPAHAMIELLPAFFAVTGLFIMATTMPVALLLKRLVLRRWCGPGAVLSWMPLVLVTCAEAVIMALCLVLWFSRIDSMLLPLKTGTESPFAPIFAVLAGSSILYSLLAFMPNLWLLSRIDARSDGGKKAESRLASAWLLSLPLPSVLVLCIFVLIALLALSPLTICV